MAHTGECIAGVVEGLWEPPAVLHLVGLPRLMALSHGDPRVTIALIDGPVADSHPDFALGSVKGGADVACNTPGSLACRHGTFVAGILHARRDSTAPGICPGCTLISRPIFAEAEDAKGAPSATLETVAEAILEVLLQSLCRVASMLSLRSVRRRDRRAWQRGPLGPAHHVRRSDEPAPF
jgi:subtilisin family serine protease